MPAIRYFTVTETREVKVTANTAIDAAKIADAAFRNGQNSDNGVRILDGVDPLLGVWGNTTSKIKVTNIDSREDY